MDDQFVILAETLFRESGGSREAASVACGYFPAWKAFELKDTFGLPLVVQADAVRRHDLKMDWMGIEYEGAKRGMDLRAEIEEAKKELLLSHRTQP